MNALRTPLTISILLALSAGYLASQIGFFRGEFREHSARMDQPPIVWASLIVLLILIGAGFTSERQKDEDSP